jgi:dihydrofolate reductase
LIISLIAAVDTQNGIGKNNQLPWQLSSDLRRFKRITMGHIIVMGRKTYETIGRVLPGRVMIVLTKQENFDIDHGYVLNSLDEAIQFAKNANENELFIIGGGEVFSQSINKADRIYLTSVQTDAHADTFFPSIDPGNWEIIEKESQYRNDQDEFNSTFRIYQRKD